MSFFVEQTDDSDGHFFDAYHLVQWVRFAKQLGGDGLPNHGDFGRALQFCGFKHATTLQGPFACFQVIIGAAHDAGAPIGVAGNHLRTRAHGRRGNLHFRHVTRNGVGIVFRQALPCRCTQAHAALCQSARHHQHDVGAQAFHLLLHAVGGATPNRNHGDDCSHANDDAQHGQYAAQGVGSKGA